MTSETKFGVQLPHFGTDCTLERLVNTASLAEELGFDSVWVRDHLFIPSEHQQHGGVTEDLILDPMLTLAAVSMLTDDLTLGTNVLIPTRHPLKLSQNLGTLSFLSEGQVIAGIGAGSFKGEFDALGLPFDERPQLIRETFEILRRTFDESDIEYQGELFEFEGVSIKPQPVSDLPLWYGGGSFASARRAVEYADGWCPPKMAFEAFFEKLEYLREREAETGRTVSVGPKAILSVHEDHDRALDALNLEAMVEDASRSHGTEFETPEDIEGFYVAGTPAEVATQLERFIEADIDHFILDLRHVFDDVEHVLGLFADEVRPQLSG